MRKKALPLSLKPVLSVLTLLAMVLAFSSVSSYPTGPEKGPSFTLKNVRAVSSGEEFSMPTWSPDGSKLLVASAHGMKLHLIDLEQNKIEQLSEVIGSGFDASWSPDGQEIYYRHRDSELQTHPEIKSIRLSDRRLKSSRLHPNGLLSASKAQKGSDVVVYINVETLGIEAETQDGKKSWAVTQDNGQYYRPLLSPDQNHLLIHSGSEMLLYALDGSGLIQSLGSGIASSWSPDNQHVLAFMDESKDGHTISGSELYMIDIANGSVKKLTSSPDLYELWPNWSPDGTKIAFEDARTGTIFVADLVQQ